jgi:hypothetical protein
MSRISRHQDSIVRTIKNRSYVNFLEENIKGIVFDKIKNYDNLASIILLTILNNRSRKLGVSLHGYYVAVAIILMELINDLANKNDTSIIPNLISTINLCLIQNIELIKENFPKNILNTSINTSKTLNEKLQKLVGPHKFENLTQFKSTDIVKYKFVDMAIDQVKQKLGTLGEIKLEPLIAHVNNREGVICQLSMYFGWILGGGEMKQTKKIDLLGLNLGMMLKIANDCVTIEEDLKNATAHTHNIVLNVGLQNSFEMFMDNKRKFIEGCLLLDIYTNTVKEVIDLMEKKVETMINNTTSDVKSLYTL